MKKIIVVSLFIISSAFERNRILDEGCGIKNDSFISGETALYKIYYSLAGVYFEAGDVQFKCKKELFASKSVYHITAVGKTTPFYDRLYKVRDRYETFIDTGSLLSYQFYRSILEGGTKKHENIRFNRQVHTAITDSGVYKVSSCTQDVLGTLYYIRNISVESLKPGDKIEFSMFMDNQIYKSYVRYIGREIVTTKYGKFHAIKIRPFLIRGTMFDSGEKMTVWVSDDGNHIPLRIQASIRIGSVKADLMEFENLRWPLNSLIKRS
jgi:Protein of unknown function (DUF3108)